MFRYKMNMWEVTIYQWSLLIYTTYKNKDFKYVIIYSNKFGEVLTLNTSLSTILIVVRVMIWHHMYKWNELLSGPIWCTLNKIYLLLMSFHKNKYKSLHNPSKKFLKMFTTINNNEILTDLLSCVTPWFCKSVKFCGVSLSKVLCIACSTGLWLHTRSGYRLK